MSEQTGPVHGAVRNLVLATGAFALCFAAWSLVSFGACQTGVLGTDKYRMRLAYVASPDVYAAVTTGWVEAPADGTYTFDSSIQPSRLFINGTSVLDWFENG